MESLDQFKNLKVYTGKEINKLVLPYKKYKERDVINSVNYFLNDKKIYGKICILYGLYGTGKTTLLMQALSHNLDNSAFIKVSPGTTMDDLDEIFKKLNAMHIKNVFIDDITNCENFERSASLLSDIYGMWMRIVATGDDTLVFRLTTLNQLYDRVIVIPTNICRYKEWVRLKGKKGLENYLKKSGVLLKKSPYEDLDKTNEYIENYIVKNIDYSLKYKDHGFYESPLFELKENGKLLDTTFDVLNNTNFISHEYEISHSHTGTPYRHMTYVLLEMNVLYDTYKSEDLHGTHCYPLAIPGLNYVINRAYGLSENEALLNVLQNVLRQELANNKRGERKVRLVKVKSFKKDFIVKEDSENLTSDIYVLEYQKTVDNKDIEFFKNQEIMKDIEWSYGKITNKYIIYLGESQSIDDIKVQNAEEFLLNL